MLSSPKTQSWGDTGEEEDWSSPSLRKQEDFRSGGASQGTRLMKETQEQGLARTWHGPEKGLVPPAVSVGPKGSPG